MHFVVEIFGEISDSAIVSPELLRFQTTFPIMLMGLTKDIDVDLCCRLRILNISHQLMLICLSCKESIFLYCKNLNVNMLSVPSSSQMLRGPFCSCRWLQCTQTQ